MTTIGLVMIVKNESRSLEKCLSLRTQARLTIQ